MVGDLGLSEYAYGLGASLFFIGYFLFEVPSNVFLERVGARIWFARIMISWGLVTIALAFTKSQAMFYVLRFLLGACEAGFFPGVLYILTLWFPFAYRARMVGSFMIFSALANAVGAPIGGMLLDLDGAAGFKGWQWVFMVTGIPAVMMGVVTLFYLDDRPENAAVPDCTRKGWLHDTLAAEDASMNKTKHGNPLRRAARRPRAADVPLLHRLSARRLWPVLLAADDREGLWRVEHGQRLHQCHPVGDRGVRALGGAGGGGPRRQADGLYRRARPVRRGLPRGERLCARQCVKFAFLCGAAAGIFAGQPVLWSLPSSFLTGAGAAAGLAAINSVGNLGGFIAQNVVPWIKDRPAATRRRCCSWRPA